MSLRHLPFYAGIRTRRQEKTYEAWVRDGKRTPPPHLAKVKEIRDYATRFRLQVLIETGTFLGDTLYAVKDLFEKIYSIELDPALHQNARKRFAHDLNITLIQGDSGVVIEELLSRIDRPCLFWLDGHYSGEFTAKGALESPVSAELHYIAQHSQKRKHVLLIDDAREFNGTHGYPTLDTLKNWATSEGYDTFEVRDDIIRIYCSER